MKSINELKLISYSKLIKLLKCDPIIIYKVLDNPIFFEEIWIYHFKLISITKRFLGIKYKTIRYE